jgi:MFS family permease
VRRLRLPEFIHEVIDDRHQRGILVASSLALFAVGLVPRVLSPGLPNAQEILRSQPEVQNLFLLLALTSTATIILGGLVADIFRRRILLVGGLAVMAIASLVSIAFDDGQIYYLSGFVSVAAAGVVLAYGIGSVAITYEGIPRATALGFVYGAFGAGAAASPALLTLFPEIVPSTVPGAPSSFTFDTSLAYGLTALASGVALVASYRNVPKIPGTLPAPPRLVAGVAFWSLAVLALVSGSLGLLGPADTALPLTLVIVGAIGTIGISFGFARSGADVGRLTLDKRAVGAALSVGVAIGFAQAVPMMLMPVVFEYPLGYGQLFAIIALAPFALALLAAGPVAGILIRRYGPRGMMAGGTLALGAANLVVAVILAAIVGFIRDFYAVNPDEAQVDIGLANYALFIIPLALIGAGFVLATTVRTAIVFASTPRGLPGSAAAINEASVSLGSRIGIVVATAVLAPVAIASARSIAEARRPEQAAELVEEFRVALLSLGTPRFKEVWEAVSADALPVKSAAYAVAYTDGVIIALLASGVVGVAGAVLAWLLIGRRDPIQTVFDMQEERERSDGHERGPAVTEGGEPSSG